ncbi:MAG: chemotaxis protein [Clostridiales bacterium]|nr:chemotaxis protein [Clostridiales bacterium]
MIGFRKKQKNKSELKVENINKDVLLMVIDDLLNNKLTYISEEEVGSKEVSGKWNKLLDKIKAEKTDNLLNLDSILSEMTRMDSLRDIIKSTSTQTDQVSNFRNSIKEMTAASEEVSSMSQNVANHTQDISVITETGVEKIEKSMDFMVGYFEIAKNINEKMDEVREKTQSINQVIGLLKGIADQTNLLALNAAIEAARAGENGKGFAIVADEVRKLAEDTRVSLENVMKDIEDLNEAIDNSSNQIEESINELDTGKRIINETLTQIHEISNSINGIDETVSQVAASMEEQHAITEILTSGIQEIAQESDFIEDKGKYLGEYVNNTSKHVHSIRREFLNNKEFLDDRTMMEVYKTDHLVWKWRVYNTLLGYERLEPEQLANYKTCRLGRWYYGDEGKKYSSLKEFKDMEEYHQKVHETASEAISAFYEGDIERADMNLESMDHYLQKMFDYIDKIKKII